MTLPLRPKYPPAPLSVLVYLLVLTDGRRGS